MGIKISSNDAAWVGAAGVVAGVGSALLTRLGNPVDGGISIACFCRDIAGALGLHQTIEFSYLRPEIPAIIMGATIAAFVKGGFSPSGGSSPVVRFFIGMMLSIAVFTFIGCPMRVGLRLAGGDPGVLGGLAGLVAGSGIGTIFLVKGFSLGRSRSVSRYAGLAFHAAAIILLVLLLAAPAFITLSRGRHAPLVVSLAIGAVVGILAQRSKLCFTGGFRNAFLIGDVTLLTGFFALVLSAGAANLLLGQAHFGIHYIGSSDFLWGFLALCAVGIASVFLGGCPFRQLIMAAQGNIDSAMSIAGITAGAAIAYNFDLAFTAGSLDLNGKIAVALILAVLTGIGFLNLKKI